MNELERIREVLDGMDVPEWVVRMEPELTYDWEGDRIVAVHTVIKDSVLDRSGPRGRTGRFRVAVQHAFRDAGIDLMAHLRYVAESEADLVG